MCWLVAWLVRCCFFFYFFQFCACAIELEVHTFSIECTKEIRSMFVMPYEEIPFCGAKSTMAKNTHKLKKKKIESIFYVDDSKCSRSAYVWFLCHLFELPQDVEIFRFEFQVLFFDFSNTTSSSLLLLLLLLRLLWLILMCQQLNHHDFFAISVPFARNYLIKNFQNIIETSKSNIWNMLEQHNSI